jgi:hypothetical protein
LGSNIRQGLFLIKRGCDPNLHGSLKNVAWQRLDGALIENGAEFIDFKSMNVLIKREKGVVKR